MKIKITTKDIHYAEKILLPSGSHFDKERICFIKNLDTIDLQAVPWSGKTTALLAKLLILEKYMPFDDWSWVLVISHTNAAVDEIKDKIGKYCPKIFTYPNFIGTIQSFVDQFLAIPAYVHKFWKKPYRIDNEIYYEKSSFLYNSLSWWVKNYLYKKKGQHKNSSDFFATIRINNQWDLLNGINWNVFLRSTSKADSYNKIKEKKEYLMKELWYLCFDDAYLLANSYIQSFPQIKKLLQKRFWFVFVDEMQDMDIHQYTLLENLFYKKMILNHCFQRIWDKNQSIYNWEVKLTDNRKEYWRKQLKLNGSHRLSEETAQIVKYFGLQYQEIIGLRKDIHIKPHIIVFEDPKKVLSFFVKLIKDNNLNDEKYPFYAIGRIGEYKYIDEAKTTPDKSKLCIKCYHENFEKDRNKPKIDYYNFKNYLKYYEESKNPLASIRKNILKAFVKILRIENKKDRNDNTYTTKTFMSFLKENRDKKYEELKLKLFEWSFSIKKWENIYEESKTFIKPYLQNIFPDITFSQTTNDFINGNIEITEGTTTWLQNNWCIYQEWDIKIKIWTIHSVKWATHTATLYTESFYEWRNGKNSYESERLINQLVGQQFNSEKKYHKQSTKMVYVWFSRPTHLLCFAIHKDRLPDNFNNENWEITRI